MLPGACAELSRVHIRDLDFTVLVRARLLLVKTVTAAYVHLNSESEELRYSAAAHPPLLLVRNGGVIQIEENGLMLGTFGYASYSTAVHKLEAGDRIVIYTDGILEASNAAGDFFGQDALCDLLTETRGLSPALTADRVISSVRQWSGKQDDDLTVLICDYMPTVGETVGQEC